MNHKPKVAVMTSDKYLNTLRGFSHLFNKYWDSEQEVDVFGFSPPDFGLPDNFNFHSLGPQDSYPVNRWSDSLLLALDYYDDNDCPIIMLEDYWLTRPVNVDVVKALYLYIRSTDNVLKVDLTTDRLYAAGIKDYGNMGFIDLIKSDPSSQYQMSLMTGIWDIRILRQILIPGETPWEVEINGTPRAAVMDDDAMVIGTRQFPVRHILAHRGGDHVTYLLDGLTESDRFELKMQGAFS